MYHRHLIGTLLGLCLIALTGCEPVTAPEQGGAVTLQAGPTGHVGAPTAHAAGGGHYAFSLLGETLPGTLSFNAKQFADGRASGQFRVTLDFQEGIPDVISGGVAAFHGRVTCVAADPANGRAWIGGVVTQNRSTNAEFRDDATTQVGKDIWFRVLDSGEGQAAPDRTTFVGFEGGGGILTSAEYCAARLWPDGNARTHPLTSGNIQVHD